MHQRKFVNEKFEVNSAKFQPLSGYKRPQLRFQCLLQTEYKTFSSFKEIMSAKIVAIGVGPYVSLKELQVMADGHYVLVEDFNKLAKAITDVMDLVCQ